jgi:hypothetical protein
MCSFARRRIALALAIPHHRRGRSATEAVDERAVRRCRCVLLVHFCEAPTMLINACYHFVQTSPLSKHRIPEHPPYFTQSMFLPPPQCPP